MSNYTEKEKNIIKQCNEGPFHTLINELTKEEFDSLVDKLITDNSTIFASLVAIYRDYNRNKIIDYYIDKGDVDLLLGFLDYCNDFATEDNELDQKYVVDKLLQKNNKGFIKKILESNCLYFLTDKKEKERLITFVKGE